jgi:Fe-S cluster biogenesis protein NfuA
MSDEKHLQQLSTQIEDLVHKIEAISDPPVKANATALIQSLLDLHARAFERVIEIVLQQKESGRGILNQIAADELIGSLLLLYRLHPDDFDVRLNKAIAAVRKVAALQGANVELIGVDGEVVRIRLSGAGHGCASTKVSLQQLIENAIYESTPEISRVEVENVMEVHKSEPLVQLQVNIPAPTAHAH